MRSMLALMVLAMLTGVARADGTACDRLAALQADPTRQAEAVGFAALDADAVITACQAALSDLAPGDSAEGRYWLQLGRGLLRAGDAIAAVEALHRSAASGYPAGEFALGTLYFLGDDAPRDHARAIGHFERAWQRGVTWAAIGLAQLYGDQHSPRHDPDLAKHWQSRWQQAQDGG